MVMETLTWTKFFVFPKCLDYMQYYMTLLALFRYTTVKDQDTVISLVEAQTRVYWVT